jgi:hypothetical protein
MAERLIALHAEEPQSARPASRWHVEAPAAQQRRAAVHEVHEAGVSGLLWESIYMCRYMSHQLEHQGAQREAIGRWYVWSRRWLQASLKWTQKA